MTRVRFQRFGPISAQGSATGGKSSGYPLPWRSRGFASEVDVSKARLAGTGVWPSLDEPLRAFNGTGTGGPVATDLVWLRPC